MILTPTTFLSKNRYNTGAEKVNFHSADRERIWGLKMCTVFAASEDNPVYRKAFLRIKLLNTGGLNAQGDFRGRFSGKILFMRPEIQ